MAVVTDISPRIQYVATQGQSVFTIPFGYYVLTDIVVFKYPQNGTPDDATQQLLYNVDYTVSTASLTGGTITLATATGIYQLPNSTYGSVIAHDSVVYSNGTAGIGATLTANGNGVFTTDGVTPVVNSIIVMKNQTAGLQNGIYVLNNAGSVSTPWQMTRTSYFNQVSPTEVAFGAWTTITGGNTLANTSWVMLTTGDIVIGTTALTWGAQGTGANAGDNITIVRSMPDDRLNYYVAGYVSPQGLNDDFNKLVLMTQQNTMQLQEITPKYNLDAIIFESDLVLPRLPANSAWVKNSADTEIIAVALGEYPVSAESDTDGRSGHVAYWSGSQKITDLNDVQGDSSSNLFGINNLSAENISASNNITAGDTIQGLYVVTPNLTAVDSSITRSTIGALTVAGNTILNTLTVSGNANFQENVSIDSLVTNFYQGDGNISVVGNINSGTWNGGVISVLRGGTGAANKTTGFNNLSPLTTKGDLLAHDGTSNVRYPAATNGYVNIYDSAETSGFRSVPLPTSGGSGTVTSVFFSGDFEIDTGSGPSQGGLITINGNVTLQPTGIISGTYDFSTAVYDVTVDAKGRIHALTQLFEDDEGEVPIIPMMGYRNLIEITDEEECRVNLGLIIGSPGQSGDVQEWSPVLDYLSLQWPSIALGLITINLSGDIAARAIEGDLLGSITVFDGGGAIGNPSVRLSNDIFVNSLSTGGIIANAKVLSLSGHAVLGLYFDMACAVAYGTDPSTSAPTLSVTGPQGSIDLNLCAGGTVQPGYVTSICGAEGVSAKIGVKDAIAPLAGEFGTGLRSCFSSQEWEIHEVELYTTSLDEYQVAYYNGPANDGIGATVTSIADPLLRFQIYDQAIHPSAGVICAMMTFSNPAWNGIYEVTNAGTVLESFILTRVDTFDQVMPSKIATNALIFSSFGPANFVLSGVAPLEVGVSPLNFKPITDYHMPLPASVPPNVYAVKAWNPGIEALEWAAPVWQGVVPFSTPKIGATIGQALIASDTVGGTTWVTPNFVLRSGDTMTGPLILSGTPTAPNQAADKAYVDAAAIGAELHDAAVLASTGPYVGIYDNGSSGVGATLTGTIDEVLIVDGQEPVVNDRLVLKDQVDEAENGIWVVNSPGSVSTVWILERATDFDTDAVGNIQQNALVPISFGDTQAGSSWRLTSAGPFTVGVTPLVWGIFNSPLNLVGIDGVTVVGNVISLTDVTIGSIYSYPSVITTNNKGQITDYGPTVIPLKQDNNLIDVPDKPLARQYMGLEIDVDVQRQRTISSISSKIVVANGSGISGNPTLNLVGVPPAWTYIGTIRAITTFLDFNLTSFPAMSEFINYHFMVDQLQSDLSASHEFTMQMQTSLGGSYPFGTILHAELPSTPSPSALYGNIDCWGFASVANGSFNTIRKIVNALGVANSYSSNILITTSGVNLSLVTVGPVVGVRFGIGYGVNAFYTGYIHLYGSN